MLGELPESGQKKKKGEREEETIKYNIRKVTDF